MILSDAEVEVSIYRGNEQTAFLCQSQLLYQDTSILPHAGLTAPGFRVLRMNTTLAIPFTQVMHHHTRRSSFPYSLPSNLIPRLQYW